ncbi:unnamed protein product [Calicophoron daubneyi]|uniref:Uncharacterized protein n=1 Tax=Calicophoron daubneyi TaxID=300641 RepID=A0AAV2T2R6_CALDB
MPLSELNGLDDDLLNLFADELKSKKKSKKTKRKVKSVFDELDRFDAEDTSSRDGEKESSFLKTKSSFLKSVKFNDSIEIKVPESPPSSSAEREEENGKAALCLFLSYT